MTIDPAVSRYIDRVSAVAPLERAEEYQLATRYALNRDADARQALVNAHLRHVVAIALKYRRYGLPIEDLIAEGNLGVLHALEKFEPQRGYRFLTYANFWIRAYIVNHVLRSWSMVGAGSGALRSKVFFRLRRERARLTNLLGDSEAVAAALAERMAMRPDRVIELSRRLDARDVSLQTRLSDDSSTELIDTLTCPRGDAEQAVFERDERSFITDAVKQSLTTLDVRERFIVEHRLMADPESELSLAEIGRRLGVSRERARQLEARAKRKLSQRLIAHSAQPGGDWLGLSAA